MKKLIFLALLFISQAAFSQVSDPLGDANRLRFEAHRLDQVVGYYNLHVQIQSTVRQFANQSEILFACLSRNPPGRPSANCSIEVQRTLNQFSTVDYYLRPTQQPYPAVFQQFLRTDYAMRMVAQSQPPPGQILSAVGYINRIQFNFRGRGQQAIYSQCLQWGHYYGIQVARNLYVNGNLLNIQPTPLDLACRWVAQYAIPGL